MVKIRQNKAAFNNDVPFGAIGFTYITVVIIFSFVITANYCNLISMQFKLIIFFLRSSIKCANLDAKAQNSN